jgi:hypothetical protein
VLGLHGHPDSPLRETEDLQRISVVPHVLVGQGGSRARDLHKEGDALVAGRSERGQPGALAAAQDAHLIRPDLGLILHSVDGSQPVPDQIVEAGSLPVA